jgi:hypothetical protein
VRWISKIALIGILVMMEFQSMAQGCAMCRAVGEGHAENNGASSADGLNNGIIYLIIVVYILLFILFRKKIVKFLRELSSMR